MDTLNSLTLLFAELITVSQAAKILERSEQMVRVLADRGSLPHMRIPDTGQRLFHKRDVEALALERQVRQLMTGHRKRGPRTAVERAKLKVVSTYQEAIA